MAIRMVPPLAICVVLAAQGADGREHLAFIGYLLAFYLVTLAVETWLAVKRVRNHASQFATFIESCAADRAQPNIRWHDHAHSTTRSIRRSCSATSRIRRAFTCRGFSRRQTRMGMSRFRSRSCRTQPIFQAQHGQFAHRQHDSAARLENHQVHGDRAGGGDLDVRVLHRAWPKRSRAARLPRGRFRNMLEAMLLYFRDNVARPCIGITTPTSSCRSCGRFSSSSWAATCSA